MKDEIFLSQFEACTLCKTEFKHSGHLRMTWLYLSQHQTDVAQKFIKEGIIRYATSLGAKHIYHETLTMLWMTLVWEAIQLQQGKDFADFLAKHPQLLDANLPIRYYSKQVLESELAKREFVPPDLSPSGTVEN